MTPAPGDPAAEPNDGDEGFGEELLELRIAQPEDQAIKMAPTISFTAQS